MVEDKLSIFVPGGLRRRLTLSLTAQFHLAGQLDTFSPVLQAGHHQLRHRNALTTFQLEWKASCANQSLPWTFNSTVLPPQRNRPPCLSVRDSK